MCWLSSCSLGSSLKSKYPVLFNVKYCMQSCRAGSFFFSSLYYHVACLSYHNFQFLSKIKSYAVQKHFEINSLFPSSFALRQRVMPSFCILFIDKCSQIIKHRVISILITKNKKKKLSFYVNAGLVFLMSIHTFHLLFPWIDYHSAWINPIQSLWQHGALISSL